MMQTVQTLDELHSALFKQTETVERQSNEYLQFQMSERMQSDNRGRFILDIHFIFDTQIQFIATVPR